MRETYRRCHALENRCTAPTAGRNRRISQRGVESHLWSRAGHTAVPVSGRHHFVCSPFQHESWGSTLKYSQISVAFRVKIGGRQKESTTKMGERTHLSVVLLGLCVLDHLHKHLLRHGIGWLSSNGLVTLGVQACVVVTALLGVSPEKFGRGCRESLNVPKLAGVESSETVVSLNSFCNFIAPTRALAHFGKQTSNGCTHLEGCTQMHSHSARVFRRCCVATMNHVVGPRESDTHDAHTNTTIIRR